MSQEDIYEVGRLERDALAAHEAQMQEPPCATCKDCYSERDVFPCIDCNILDSNKPVSHWRYYKENEE